MRNLQRVEEHIDFDPARHRYRFRGTPYKSVTTYTRVLDKPALNAWKVRQQMRGTARKCLEEPGFATRLLAMTDQQLRYIEFEADKVANEAAELGSEVHALIEHWAKGEMGKPSREPVCSDRAFFLFEDFMSWAGKGHLTVLGTEMRLASVKLGYTGTLDLLALSDDRLAVVDWKTKAGPLWPEEVLQLAAYRNAVEEWTGIQPSGLVIRIPKDGSKVQALDPDEVAAYPTALAAFSACVGLSKWLEACERSRS